jgi:hypothetical protein
MAVNGIGVPPTPGTDRWRDAIRTQHAHLSAEERADPPWATTGNDDSWVDFLQAQYDADINSTDGLVGQRNTWNKEGRVRFWGILGRTLLNVVDDIHNGAPRLEMPPSMLPSPRATARWHLELFFLGTGAVESLPRTAPCCTPC